MVLIWDDHTLTLATHVPPHLYTLPSYFFVPPLYVSDTPFVARILSYVFVHASQRLCLFNALIAMCTDHQLCFNVQRGFICKLHALQRCATDNIAR